MITNRNLQLVFRDPAERLIHTILQTLKRGSLKQLPKESKKPFDQMWKKEPSAEIISRRSIKSN